MAHPSIHSSINPSIHKYHISSAPTSTHPTHSANNSVPPSYPFPFSLCNHLACILYHLLNFLSPSFLHASVSVLLTEHLSLLGQYDLASSAGWIDGQCLEEGLLDVGAPDTLCSVALQLLTRRRGGRWSRSRQRPDDGLRVTLAAGSTDRGRRRGRTTGVAVDGH